MNTETRKKLSEKLKAKWASGTRKPLPAGITRAASLARWANRVEIPGKPKSVINGVRNPEYRKWRYEQTEALTKRFRNGSEESKSFYADNLRKVRNEPAAIEKRLAALRSSEKLKINCRKIQVPGLGMKMHPELFSKNAGENHVSAVVFSVRSPEGIHFRFRNLNAFIRDNPDLFEDGDALWHKIGKRGRDVTCRACGGINSIKPSDKKRRVNGSWKGWVWVTLNERALNNAADPMDRALPNAH